MLVTPTQAEDLEEQFRALTDLCIPTQTQSLNEYMKIF